MTGRAVREAVDQAIAAIAGPQHGLATRVQLLALGVTDDSIAYRIAIGRLHPVHRGVYAVGHRPISPYAYALAAVLACGSGAVLSHGSAATLWGATNQWRHPLEVTARCARRPARLHVHRSSTLAPQDITQHYGIPVTAPARTLRDIANRLTDTALARAVNDLRLAGFLRLPDLEELLNRRPSTRLRRHLDHPEAPTRSTFEDVFLRFAKRYRLPKPEINSRVAGHEVDIFFPEHHLVVELDGYESHSSREQFETDRDRDPDLLAAGVATVRLTWRRFRAEPAREAARLHAILRARTS